MLQTRQLLVAYNKVFKCSALTVVSIETKKRKLDLRRSCTTLHQIFPPLVKKDVKVESLCYSGYFSRVPVCLLCTLPQQLDRVSRPCKSPFKNKKKKKKCVLSVPILCRLCIFKSQDPPDQKTQGSVCCHGARSGDGAPTLHRLVQGWHWVLAGARGHAGTVNRCLNRGAEPDQETCGPVYPREFCRRPNSPIEIYFHSWKKSRGCGCCYSHCSPCEEKTKSRFSQNVSESLKIIRQMS